MSSLCVPNDDFEIGLEWANNKAQTLTFWTVSISFKGEKISIPVQPSNPILVCVEFLLDAYSGIDDSSVKILYKGRKLDFMKSFEDEKIMNGAKLMMIASSTSDVKKIKASRSDPTIRGFENEKKLSLIREKGLDPSRSSVWRSEQHHEFKFSKLEMVAYELGECSPHPYEAQALLLKLATDPGIIECMVQHQWHVSKLCEMDPRKDTPKKEGACTLGYNENFGARIYIRLRTDDLRKFRPYRELINTLLHELSHNLFGPHGTDFWSLFSKLKMRYLTCHANLQSKGTMVAGVSAGKLADISESGDAQNMTVALKTELAASASNSALSPGEREAAALVAASVSLMEQPNLPTQHPSNKIADVRLAAAMAAEQRMKMATTSTGFISGDPVPPVSEKSFVTGMDETNSKDKMLDDDSNVKASNSTKQSKLPIEKISDSAVRGVQTKDSVQTSAAVSIQDSIETLKVANEFGDNLTRKDVSSTLDTLSKIVRNIKNNPSDIRYQKLRRSNMLFARTIGSSKPAMAVLSELGFDLSKLEEDEIVMKQDPDLSLFSVASECLDGE